jgi:hypothetical protein
MGDAGGVGLLVCEPDGLIGHQTRAVAYADRLGRLPARAMQSASDPVCSEPNDAAPRQFYNQFVVPEPPAALHQPEVSDQAVLSAAHSGESDIHKTPHRSSMHRGVSASILDKSFGRRVANYRFGMAGGQRRLAMSVNRANRKSRIWRASCLVLATSCHRGHANKPARSTFEQLSSWIQRG